MPAMSPRRSTRWSDEALRDELLTQVRLRAVAKVSDLLARFDEQRGRNGAAVEGLPNVVAALRRGQVDTVLLHDDPSATTQLWVGPEPLHIGLEPADVAALGVAEPAEDRADAAIVRALAATDGALVLAPAGRPEMRDGIGALLRYADQATGSA